MQYYIGAYHLIRLREVEFGRIKGTKIYTCSSCINDRYFDSWSLSWTVDGKSDLTEQKEVFGLTDELITNIQKWADYKFDQKKVGWLNTFTDFETLLEYKNQFFPNDRDCLILSVNFPDSECEKLLAEFEQEAKQDGSIGLWDNLNERTPERTDESEQFIGYDLIGLESGDNFHTFHCHDVAEDLNGKFKAEINEYGLLNSDDKWIEMVEYMNDVNNGFKPVPWYFVKVKLVDENKAAKNIMS